MSTSNLQKAKLFTLTKVVFDIETTGLAKSSTEIIQLSCITLDGSEIYSSYAVPAGSVSPSATNVHGITTAIANGQRVLMKENRQVEAPLLFIVLREFAQYISTIFKVLAVIWP